jgi:hypothetical protein
MLIFPLSPITMDNSTRISAPDLRQRSPRSPRSRLGNYVTLQRMLDKGRAIIIGQEWQIYLRRSFRPAPNHLRPQHEKFFE